MGAPTKSGFPPLIWLTLSTGVGPIPSQENPVGFLPSWHLRSHTFATRLYRKTGDLYLVQKALGHRQITTTEIYARVSDEALREAVSAA